jgi:hypothetical protein
LKIATILLMSGFAFGQAQPANTPQSTAPANQASPSSQTDEPTVAGAANAARQKAETGPPVKIYRNKDVRDPDDSSATSQGTTATPGNSNTTPVRKAATPLPAALQSPAAFKAQGDAYRNQVLQEKEKISDIQNRMTRLKYKFDSWSTSFAQDPTDASVCWTSGYSTPYYNSWCGRGRKLKSQYDAAESQLKKENAHLEKMQEDIRRKGYGNAVYDPDWP